MKRKIKYRTPSTNRGKVAYNNGIVTRYFYAHETIPSGYIKGAMKRKLNQA